MSGSDSRKHRGQGDHDTQEQVGNSSRVVPVAEQVHGLEREGGEGRVSATNPDSQKCPDFGADRRGFQRVPADESQEERPADVDNQCAKRKRTSAPVLNKAAEQVSADSSECTTQRDVPDHPFPFLDPQY